MELSWKQGCSAKLSLWLRCRLLDDDVEGSDCRIKRPHRRKFCNIVHMPNLYVQVDVFRLAFVSGRCCSCPPLSVVWMYVYIDVCEYWRLCTWNTISSDIMGHWLFPQRSVYAGVVIENRLQARNYSTLPRPMQSSAEGTAPPDQKISIDSCVHAFVNTTVFFWQSHLAWQSQLHTLTK
jgi:hypothetical protein